MNARGTFEVKLSPQPLSYDAGGAPLARLSLEKVFHGDLEGTSNGEMLSAGNPHTGFGGYVAIERVSGTLHGRAGSFILQHSGTMNGATTSVHVAVVPNSGAGDLAGISGTFTLIREGGAHAYDFEYTLP